MQGTSPFMNSFLVTFCMEIGFFPLEEYMNEENYELPCGDGCWCPKIAVRLLHSERLALPPPVFAPSPPVLRVHNCTVARGTIVCTILYRVVLQVVELYSQSSTIHLKWNHSQTKVPGEQTHTIC